MELIEGIFVTFFYIILIFVVPIGAVVLAIGAIVKILQAFGVISKPENVDDK